MSDSSSAPSYRWGRLLAGFFGVEIAMISAAVAWVAFYSHVLHPGLPMEAYHQEAARAAPWASIVAGVPAFYFIARWASRGSGSFWTAPGVGIFGLFMLLEVLLLSQASTTHFAWWFLPMNYTVKALACALGVRAALPPTSVL